MSIYNLKPQFQNLLRPLVRGLFRQGVTANQITVMACCISFVLGVVLIVFSEISNLFWLLPLWMFLRMALNAIDGMLAREFNQKSALGGYLNEITDVLADSMLYLPFAFIFPFHFSSIFCLIYFAAFSEFIGVLGQIHGNSRRYDGPMGKSDRAFVFGALGLAYAVFGTLPDWLNYAIWAVVILLLLTCFNRLKNGLIPH